MPGCSQVGPQKDSPSAHPRRPGALLPAHDFLNYMEKGNKENLNSKYVI